MVDRQGVKRTLLWGHLLWAVVPLIWIPATPTTALPWLGAAALVGGVGATTALTAANKLITRLPPPGHVPMYVAVSTCVGSLSGACAALCAGLLLQALHGMSWQIGPVTVGGFHVLFATSALLCGVSMALIRRIGEPARPSALPAA
jgi:MFS family permease